MNRNNEEKQYECVYCGTELTYKYLPTSEFCSFDCETECDIKDEMTGKMPIYYYPVADKRIKHIQKVWTNNVDKERNEIRKNGGIIVPSPYTEDK